MNRAAKLVREWREAQEPRLRQRDAARRFGLSLTHWWRIENGDYVPSLPVALEMQAAGICSCDDWLAIDEAARGGVR